MKCGDIVIYNAKWYRILFVYRNGLAEIEDMSRRFTVELVSLSSLEPLMGTP
ncbi:hypothetical protein OH784_07335 [Ectobacillus funiculus]|uniref:Uncharacterized protein n=1 Tax=Ectobacillus funiculus TaxID=137993 RepID=A0ABV5WEM3_9BACI